MHGLVRERLELEVHSDVTREHFRNLKDAVLEVRVLAIGDVLRGPRIDRSISCCGTPRRGAGASPMIDDDDTFRVRHAGLVEFLPAVGDDARAGDVLDGLGRPEADRLLQKFRLLGFAHRIDRVLPL